MPRPRFQNNYASAVACLEGGRNKMSRPIGNNTRLVRTNAGVGVKLHGTVVVEYLADDTIVLNTGGWRTVTTRARIRDYSPVRICTIKGAWHVTHSGDEVTPARIKPCRACKGIGHSVEKCQGYAISYAHSGPRILKPCWHDSIQPHLAYYNCWRCQGSGVRDYGSKPVSTPFEDGIVVDSTGKVVGTTLRPVDTSGVTAQSRSRYGTAYFLPTSPAFTPQTDEERIDSYTPSSHDFTTYTHSPDNLDSAAFSMSFVKMDAEAEAEMAAWDEMLKTAGARKNRNEGETK